MASQYLVFRINSLDGGMIRSFSPQLLNQEAGYMTLCKNLSLENTGVPHKRPAALSQFETPANATGLHYFNQLSSGTLFRMAAYDDKVAHYDGAWNNVQTGLAVGKNVNFLTIADQVIFCNGEDFLRVWDGTTVQSEIGAENATMRTFLLFEHNDLRFTAKTGGSAGNNIRIRYIKNDTANTAASVEVTGAGTEDDPYFITTYIRWEMDGELEKITTTSAQVKTLIEGNVTANALVEVEHVPGSDGTRAVLTLTETPLMGGYDAIEGKYLEEYRLRAVIAGDPENPSLLQLSHTGDPHLWSPHKVGSNAVFAYVSPDDGEGISGLLNMGDGGLLIGKPHSLYGLFGYKRENFVIDKIDPNVGVASHRSMVFMRPYGYFVGPEGIYRVEPGGVPYNIAEPIRDIFDNWIDHNRLADSVGMIYRDQYLISLPDIGGGFFTLCFHIKRERWSLWTQPNAPTDYSPYDGEKFFITSGHNHVLKLEEKTYADFDNEIIGAEIQTVELDAGLPHLEKDVGDLYVVLKAYESEGIINIQVYADWEREPFVTVDRLCETVEEEHQLVIRIPLGKTLRFMRIHLQHTNESNFSPLALMYTYQPKEVL